MRAARRRELSLHLRIGLGDPAEAGRAWALLGPAAALLGSVPGARIEVEPDFLEATLAMNASGRIKVVPARLIYLGLALLLSPTVWRSIRRAARAA